MSGIVFAIEEFSVFDGPGIRTTVFLKGCPLKCSWCHNPEGQRRESEIVRSPNGCIGCGACEACAVQANGRLIFTQDSISSCPRDLLRVSGNEFDAESLVAKIMKNERALLSGGVTFSGGEPFYQSAFLLECLEKLKGRLHTAVQTSGFADAESFGRALKMADYFLFDLKLAGRDDHLRYTGVYNDIILENFRSLVRSGKDFVVRIPLIPTVTDTEENINGICEILLENGVKYVELLPYNKMAGGKYKLVGRKYEPDFDSERPVTIREDIFARYGIKIKIL